MLSYYTESSNESVLQYSYVINYGYNKCMAINKSAILVGVELPDFHDFTQAFEELDNLALACNYYVVKKVKQAMKAPTSQYFIGSGKVFEIKALLEETGAQTVIFDHELSPVHIRNLEKALEVNIVDRTMLILEIFESRAKTKEAKLQVALAKSQYMLPRLIDSEASLEQQKSGKGSKGKGEQKLELDKRRLRLNITKIKSSLKAIVTARRTQRAKRDNQDLFVVAIVGYTNAGKSALMNQFLTISHRSEQKKVFEKDMVFATLQTTSRLISLQNMIKFLAVDTVGFIRRLPHHLIEAFKSTLEEVKDADLILHVVDIADPEFPRMIEVVKEVLKALGVMNIPVLYVLNKIDLIAKPQAPLPTPAVKISALKGIGMPNLMMKVTDYILADYEPFVFHIPYTEADIMNKIKQDGIILNSEYLESEIVITVALHERFLQYYEQYLDHKNLD